MYIWCCCFKTWERCRRANEEARGRRRLHVLFNIVINKVRVGSLSTSRAQEKLSRPPSLWYARYNGFVVLEFNFILFHLYVYMYVCPMYVCICWLDVIFNSSLGMCMYLLWFLDSISFYFICFICMYLVCVFDFIFLPQHLLVHCLSSKM